MGRGLMAQPFVAAALAFALFPLVQYSQRLVVAGDRGSVDWLDGGIGFAILTGVVASFITGGLAYPTLNWLLKRGSLTLRQTFIAGVVFGNVPTAIILLAGAAWRFSRGESPTLTGLTYGVAGLLRLVMFGSVLGTGSAAVFWWVGGRHLSRERR